jgi:hypothetical protein
MKKYPLVERKHRDASKKSALEVPERKITGKIAAPGDEDVAPVAFIGQSFLSFRYSYTEITAEGRTARVRSHRARYENGKLESERFEGEIDRGDYERKLAEAQSRFEEHTREMVRSVFSMFPLLRKIRD